MDDEKSTTKTSQEAIPIASDAGFPGSGAMTNGSNADNAIEQRRATRL